MHVLRADLDVLRLAERSVTFAMAVKGGTITISTSSISPISSRNVVDEPRFALRHVHLPIRGDDFFSHSCSSEFAIEVGNQCSVLQIIFFVRPHAGQLFPFEQFERRAAAGGDESHLVRQARLVSPR